MLFAVSGRDLDGRPMNFRRRSGRDRFVEEFSLTPSDDIKVDLEIVWPFRIRRVRETHQDAPTAGPSEWTDAEREKILKLFRKRLAMKGRVRYIPEEPAKKPNTPPSADGEKIAQ